MSMDEFISRQPTQASRKHTVVFADDEPDILMAMECELRDEPYDLRMTTDPKRALEWIRKLRVSVMISDYRMPEMNGTTLLQLTQASSPRTVRILLTAYPCETAVLRGRKSGLLILFGKPWDTKELKRTIRERLRERDILDGV